MDVKVESTITLTINGQKFELTRAEAFLIYNQLGNVVGNTGPTYPSGIRDWPLTMPNTTPVYGPITRPNDIPCTPTPFYKPFEVTCETK